MSRSALLAIAAAVLLLVGVAVAIAVLGGEGDDGGRAQPNEELLGGEGIDAQDAPSADEQEAPPDQPTPGSEKSGGKGGKGGPPPKAQHAKSFDERMAGVGYPNEITKAGADAVRAVEAAAGPEVEAGQQTVIAADCRRGVCSVRYRMGPRGTGHILAIQQRILRNLFADAEVRRVVLYVHHKTVGRKKEERPAFIVVSCTRRPGIVWSRVTARQIDRHCEVTDNAGGKLRNNVRRGQLSVEEASGGSSPSNQGGGSAGRQAPKGAKPPGTPAPRTVKPKPAKPEDDEAG
ncbi:MAG: hypothetical protein M3320_07690 [Actinomycetota bacterium]|nr:hypothetical protein [Actinomycetota bacterium]